MKSGDNEMRFDTHDKLHLGKSTVKRIQQQKLTGIEGLKPLHK